MPRYTPLPNSPNVLPRTNPASIPAQQHPSIILICLESFFKLLYANLPRISHVVGYGSGFLFSLGWWLFIDGVAFSTTKWNQGAVNFEPIKFEDWIPGIFSTLSLIMSGLSNHQC